MARRFNGSSDFYTFARNSGGFGSLVKQRPYTVSVWFRPTTVDGNRHVITGDWNNGGNLESLVIEVAASNTIQIHQNTGVGDDTGFTAVANAWHHVLVVWDGATRYQYVNGTLKVSGALASIPAGVHFTVGRAGDFTSLYFTGDVAEFAVWDAAMLPAQGGYWEYLSPLRIRPERLVFYLPLSNPSVEYVRGRYGALTDERAIINNGPTPVAHPFGLLNLNRRLALLTRLPPPSPPPPPPGTRPANVTAFAAARATVDTTAAALAAVSTRAGPRADLTLDLREL